MPIIHLLVLAIILQFVRQRTTYSSRTFVRGWSCQTSHLTSPQSMYIVYFLARHNLRTTKQNRATPNVHSGKGGPCEGPAAELRHHLPRQRVARRGVVHLQQGDRLVQARPQGRPHTGPPYRQAWGPVDGRFRGRIGQENNQLSNHP